MRKSKTSFPAVNPYNDDAYDDDNIPEIDLPKVTESTHEFPDEIPYHNHSEKKLKNF